MSYKDRFVIGEHNIWNRNYGRVENVDNDHGSKMVKVNGQQDHYRKGSEGTEAPGCCKII